MEDIFVLAVSLIRPVLWILGATFAYKYRNWFAFAGCVTLFVTSIPIAFQLAGYHVPAPFLDLSNLVSTPGVMLVVAGILYSYRAFKKVDATLHKLDRLK